MALILDTGQLYTHRLIAMTPAIGVARHLIEEAAESLVIASPVLVEVDYWIHQRLHPGVLVALLDDIAAGAYRIEALQPEDHWRVRELCDQYADAGIGFVDAAVLAITERLREPKLATLDRGHFGMIRPRPGQARQLLPEAIQV